MWAWHSPSVGKQGDRGVTGVWQCDRPGNVTHTHNWPGSMWGSKLISSKSYKKLFLVILSLWVANEATTGRNLDRELHHSKFLFHTSLVLLPSNPCCIRLNVLNNPDPHYAWEARCEVEVLEVVLSDQWAHASASDAGRLGPRRPGPLVPGSPGELQSSASYCKVLHNLGQGPRIVLAWLIADARPQLNTSHWPQLTNERPPEAPADQSEARTQLILLSEAERTQGPWTWAWLDRPLLASNCSELSLTRILSPGDEMLLA